MNMVSAHPTYLFGSFRLETRNWQLFNSQGENVKLSVRSSDVLAELIKQRGNIVSKDHLMSTIWSDVVVEENNIVQAISSIRKALADPKEQSRYIQTVSGRGYCFIAEVKIEENPPEEARHGLLSRINLSSKLFAQYKTGVTVCIAIISVLLFVAYFRIKAGSTDQSPVLASEAVLGNIADFQSAEVIPDSIVVMPLTNLSLNPKNNLYAVGFHNELTSQLIKLNSLKVIAHNGTLNFSGKAESVSEPFRMLKAETVMYGAISFFNDDSAHISLQAIEVASGLVLWAESYDVSTRNFSEIFTIQRQIAVEVANILLADVQPLDVEPLTSLRTQSFDAYRYYTAAKEVHNHQEIQEKWQLIRKALDLDPYYADALLLFASINSTLITNPLNGYTTDEHLQLMISSVDAYLSLQPEGTRAYALKAVALGVMQNWKGVHQQIEILTALDAGISDMKYVALLLMCLGDFEGAIEIYQENLIVEPVNLYSRGFMVAAYEMSGMSRTADMEYNFGNELTDTWWGDNVNILVALGRNELVTNAGDLLDISPVLINLLNNQNDHEAIRKGVSDYLSGQEFSSAEGVFYAALAAYSGDIEDALSVLKQIINNASTAVAWIWLPVFNDVRKTDGFKKMLVEFGLISYWREYGWPEICQPVGDSFTCH